MDNGEKKKIALQAAREKFLKEYSADSETPLTQQFDERMKRYRHLSGTDHDVEPRQEDGFRKRSSSYGQALSPNLSARIKDIKDFLKRKPKSTSSSESISGKSPPSPDYLMEKLRLPSEKYGSKGNSPSPWKSTTPRGSRQNSQNDSPATVPSIESDYYVMNHKYRGRVMIFNHVSFQDGELPEREGAEKDVQNLKTALLKLGFTKDKIEVLKDYPFSDINKKLDSVGQDDHTDNDLLMVFVLTHGEKDDRIHAFDHEYQVSKLWKSFTAEKCKSLAGKPKIFFIVACRGDSLDGGAQVPMVQQRRKASINTETDAALMGPVVSYTIPVWADFLTIYSTVQGYYSYRDADEGTWYIKALCDEIGRITEKKEPYSFTDLLVRVNRNVAISYQTYNENPAYDKKKQCPFISSTLTRLIKFGEQQ